VFGFESRPDESSQSLDGRRRKRTLDAIEVGLVQHISKLVEVANLKNRFLEALGPLSLLTKGVSVIEASRSGVPKYFE